MVAKPSDLGEPGILYTMVEYINAMLEQDVARSQESHHVEEGVLVLVDQGGGRQGSRQKMESRARGAWVETLEPL